MLLPRILSAHNRSASAELHALADEAEGLEGADAAALAHLARGMGYLHTDTYADAQHCLEAALQGFEGLGDHVNAAHALLNLGVVSERLSDHAKALELYHRTLAIATDQNHMALMGAATSNIGVALAKAGDLPAALAALQRSLAIEEEHGDRVGTADVIGNIGIVYQQTGDFPTALDAYRKAVDIHEQAGNRRAAAMTIGNIGIVYQSTGDYDTALSYFSQALALHTESGNRASAARVTGNMGIVHANMGNYDAAIDFGLRSMALHAEIGNTAGHLKVAASVIDAYVSNGRLADARTLLERIESVDVDVPQIRATILSVKGHLLQQEGALDDAHAVLLEALRIMRELGLRPMQADLHQGLRELAQLRNDFAGYIEHNSEYTRITEEIRGKEATTKLAMQESQRKLEAQEREHAKYLAVLHSTLPKDVAARVARGEVVNDTFDNAAVLFLDVVGFTSKTSELEAGVVVDLLQDIFTTFDAICAQHNVMKIKTIGDSYMAVAFPSEHHVENLAAVALAMQACEFVWPHTNERVMFRIGLHCGPVVAGVLGTERMQYDVWGDTVNVASRMESSGEAGRVHTSEAFASNLKISQESRIKNPISESHSVSHPVPLVTRHVSLVTPLVTTFRGMVDIKGKGPMQTYWLEMDA